MSQDLRTYLARLEQQGELVRIRKEVNPIHEVAAVMKRAAEKGAPALYFENIQGSDIHLVSNVHASLNRLAMAMHTSVEEINDTYRSRILSPIPPARVRGSGQPEKLESLSQLPIIKIHELDAGRYITAGAILAAHPDTGKINLSLHRMCPISDNEAGIYVSFTSDLGAYAKANKGKPLPVVVAIGLHPAFLLVSATRFPAEYNEIDIVGGLLMEGVRLTQSKAGQWIVPEAAEIILEGEIDFNRLEPEGPFGEHPGYYGAGSLVPKPNPVISFHTMSCKKAPIYQTVIPGPGMKYESTYFSALSKESALLAVLSGIWPQICKVVVSIHRYMAVVQVNGDLSDDEAKKLMAAVFANQHYIKYTVLVDSDVDARDSLDVIWAMCTRVDPTRHLHVFPNQVMESLDPSTNGSCDKIGFDARKPIGDAGDAFVRTRIPGFEDVKLEDYFDRH
jgi:2,5-furandicarboxylate decarboxylase 1